MIKSECYSLFVSHLIIFSRPNPVLPPILPPGQKKGPVQNIQNREKDHRRSAPANMNRESHL